tara:strand:+ start:77 stop:1087 length:1011 start_codon:yes stop_codon:yes gene_type:complete
LAQVETYHLIIYAIFLDFLIGDPYFLLHPVEIIGFYIRNLTKFFTANLKRRGSLLLAGLFISLSTIAISYYSGRFIEILYFKSEGNIFLEIVFIISLSSCLATKNLISSAKEITNLINEKSKTECFKDMLTQKVQRLVSRDVSSSSLEALLRATTESLTENSVDGIFGPIFWICIGSLLIKHSLDLPGPISLGFSYKAISTLDSMIGYKYNSLKYLGFFSAKVEDIATFIPCRLVAISLPFTSNKIFNYKNLINKTFIDGKKYASPNSGISEAIFAHIANVQLGGENKYLEGKEFKPIINFKGNNCSPESIQEICRLILKLKILWIIIFSFIYFIN